MFFSRQTTWNWDHFVSSGPKNTKECSDTTSYRLRRSPGQRGACRVRRFFRYRLPSPQRRRTRPPDQGRRKTPPALPEEPCQIETDRWLTTRRGLINWLQNRWGLCFYSWKPRRKIDLTAEVFFSAYNEKQTGLIDG